MINLTKNILQSLPSEIGTKRAKAIIQTHDLVTQVLEKKHRQ